MAFWSWSKTPGSNATADPTINWAEGMSPSAINDSARAQMARTAEWRDDISGTLTTGGTSTAYTLATNQGFDTLAHMNGAMLAFVPHVTNGAVVTIAVDGLNPVPLRSSPGVELGAGTLIQGTPYVTTYNNSDGAAYLQGFVGNPFNIPVGGLMPYLGSSAPNSNFVLPFGQAISRTTYSALFALVSTTFGAGDETTTFNLPDMRGRAIFGLDNMGGSAASRITVAGGNFDGTVLGQTGGAQNQTLTQAQLPAVAPTFTGSPSTTATATYLNSTTGTPALGFQSGASNLIQTSVTITPQGTVGNLGSGNSHPIMPPSIVIPFILRVI